VSCEVFCLIVFIHPYYQQQLAEFFHAAMVAANLISDETKERISSGEKLPQGPGYAGCVCGIQINLEKVRLFFIQYLLSELLKF
jgi:hypothetical protein